MNTHHPDSDGLLAIIGGTGVDLRSGNSSLHGSDDERVHTPWGSAHVTRAHVQNEGASDAESGAQQHREVVFLHRHADPDALGLRSLPPHRINYRANIAALRALGVTGVLASTAVGSLRPDWRPGTLVLLDQFIDCTSNRTKTFFDERTVHVDVTTPYCPYLRGLLLETAARLGIELVDGGTYLCTDGPRFETPAEVRAYAQWGGDVVGMTGVPEAPLAREANLSYVGVSIVTNLGAGISPVPLTQLEVHEAMREALPRVTQLFLAAAMLYRDDPTLPARNATREFQTHDFDPSRLFG